MGLASRDRVGSDRPGAKCDFTILQTTLGLDLECFIISYEERDCDQRGISLHKQNVVIRSSIEVEQVNVSECFCCGRRVVDGCFEKIVNSVVDFGKRFQRKSKRACTESPTYLIKDHRDKLTHTTPSSTVLWRATIQFTLQQKCRWKRYRKTSKK